MISLFKEILTIYVSLSTVFKLSTFFMLHNLFKSTIIPIFKQVAIIITNYKKRSDTFNLYNQSYFSSKKIPQNGEIFVQWLF